jgi:hypothetical protein
LNRENLCRHAGVWRRHIPSATALCMPRRKLRAARWIQHRTPRGSISVAGNPTDDKNACTKVSDARRRGFSFSNPDHPGSVVFCSVLHPCTLRDHHLASPRKFLNLYIIATGGPAWSHEVRGVPHQRPAVPNLLNDSAAIRRPVYGATFKLVVFPLPPGPLFTAKQHATKPKFISLRHDALHQTPPHNLHRASLLLHPVEGSTHCTSGSRVPTGGTGRSVVRIGSLMITSEAV